MAEENGNNAQGWSDGGPSVSEMDSGSVDREISQIESHPAFAGESDMDHWSRQRMLKRRSDLYKHESRRDPEREAAVDLGIYDALKAQGMTKESLEADIERFAERDWQEAIDKTKRELETRFGGKEEAETHIQSARNIIKRFGKQEDHVFLEESGLGNDPDFIEALAKVGRLLEAKWDEAKKRRKS